MNFLAKKTNIPSSATIQLLDRVKELKRARHEVISLSADEPDFVTPEHIRMYAKRALDEGYTFYPDSAGLMELREASAEKLRRDNRVEAGDSFGSRGEGYVRLSFATSRDNLATAFNRMRHVMSEIHN